MRWRPFRGLIIRALRFLLSSPNRQDELETGRYKVQRWCGIDWSEHHHDIAIVDEAGSLISKARIQDTAAGFAQLLDLLAVHGHGCDSPIPVAIETARGLLVANLRAAGVRVFAINPLSVARYRDRYAPSRSKSDAADAVVLANIVRTDPTVHRLIPDDSELAASIWVLARAHQDAIWDRQQTVGKLRSILREYYPGFVAIFEDLSSREALATLRLAPSPAAVPTLRRSSLAAALRRAGRSRYVDRDVAKILTGLRTAQLRQPALVEAAMAVQASTYGRALTTLVENIHTLRSGSRTPTTLTPTPRSSVAFPGSAPSSVHGSSARSETTTPGSPPPADSKPSPAPHPSPGPAAPRSWSPCAPSATSASDRPPTYGPCRCLPTHPAREPTTTAGEPAETPTRPPPATSPTAASACCTTA